MYIFKNAYLNIVRAKGRNVLIGLIIMAITVGACITITINKSGNALVSTYKESNPLEISLNLDAMSYRNATDEEKESFELLNVDTINKIGNLDMVTGYYYTMQSSLNSDDIDAISYDELFAKPSDSEDTDTTSGATNSTTKQAPTGGGNFMSSGDYTIVAYSDISYNEDFVDGNKKITDGTMIDKDNTDNDIVISEELATENDLAVGDTITFINTNDDTVTYDLKVVGIYEIVNDTTTSAGPGRMQGNSSNQIYTNLTVLNQIIEDDGTDTESYSMSSSISSNFYIAYEDLDAFTTAVRDLGVSDYYTINTNEDEITATLEPIKSIASFSLTFLIVILVVGGIVLTIINLFNIRERKYEIGVLRAIGMTKTKVTMQLVSEIFIVALVALIVGTTAGTILSQPVSNYMLANEIESYTTSQNNISENFGGEGFSRPGFNGSEDQSSSNGSPSKPSGNMRANTVSADDYVSSLEVHTDFVTIIELFGVSLLLTIISGVTAVMFVNKYEPNKILQNRG